jgi:hypothetical protein
MKNREWGMKNREWGMKNREWGMGRKDTNSYSPLPTPHSRISFQYAIPNFS